MVKMGYSKALGRKIRTDSWGEIGIPTVTRIEEAIRQGNTEEALELLHYLNPESKTISDLDWDWIYALLTFIAENFGEEQLLPALKYSFSIVGLMPYYQRQLFAGNLEEGLQILAEANRVHRHGRGQMGEFTLADEGNKFVLTLNPCGSGGRMRRGDPIDKSPPRTGPPYNLGRTKKAYPWSWGKAGVPYYCVHCCVWGEIIPTERRGYPARITLHPDNPDDPCRLLFYKNPTDIPEEYFARIGFSKDPSKIQKRE